MGFKSWQWCCNKDYDAQQEAIKQGGSVAYGKEVVSKAVQYIYTKLRWFSKENTNFTARFYIDGVENETGFYLTIPWLFHIHIYGCWDYNAFKARWPSLSHNDIDKAWGFCWAREYISLEWGHSYEDTLSGTKEQGFYWLKDWSDLIRGEIVDVTWEKGKQVLKVEKGYTTGYKVNNYPPEVDIVDVAHMFDQMGAMHGRKCTAKEGVFEGPVSITIPITVYKRTGTWTYKRWFKVKRDIYEVAADVAIIVPGKGENSWDQDDELIQSKYNPETGTCDFSSGADTPEAAVDAYINSIRKKFIR